MRKTMMFAATAMVLGAITIASSNNAQARFGGEAIAAATNSLSSAEPAQYRNYRRYRAYRAYPRYYGGYGAYAYSPGYNAFNAYAGSAAPNGNFWYNAPASIYTGSREALDTCSLC